MPFPVSPRAKRLLIAVLLPAAVALLSALIWPLETSPLALRPLLRPFQQIEWNGYDALFYGRGRLPDDINPRIVVVGFENQTEGLLEDGPSGEPVSQPWPPPRRFHARVLDRMVEDGAKVVVFDVLMHPPSPAGIEDDRAFAAAVKRAKGKGCRVVLACRIERGSATQSKKMVGPYYDIDKGVDLAEDAKVGFVEIYPEQDGIVRRLYPLQRFQGEWLPSLPAAAYLEIMGEDAQDSRQTEDTLFLGKLEIPRTGGTMEDKIDAENNLGTSYIDFPGGAATFPRVEYSQVYRGKFKPGTFQNRVVFVGISGTELTRAQNDFYQTAYSHFFEERIGGRTTRDVDGVVVQAQMLNALLMRRFVHHAAPWQTFLAVFIYALLGTWGVRYFMNWRGPTLLLCALIGYVTLSYSLFASQNPLYLPWAMPLILMLLSAAAVAWVERGEMRRRWAGYVSPAYLEVMLREGFEAKPRRHDATVLFGDIRGFTALSETQTPENVVRLLDQHLEKLVPIIFEEGGTVDKFLGDGVMVVFGAPKPQADAALRAVRAAWRMCEAAQDPVTDGSGAPHTLATGFGVATGPLVAGHVGSKELLTFTLIGDTVNLASRLQAVTGGADVIIDEATYELVRGAVTVEPLGMQQVKGKRDGVNCYRVLSCKGVQEGQGAAAENPKPARKP